MAVILLTTVCLSAVWWLTLRNQQIDARLDHLSSEAEEIAYLAGNLSGSSLMDTVGDRDSETRTYLNRTAEKVSQEFNAFIIVMDRNQNGMIYNAISSGQEDPAFVDSLKSDDINAAMDRILNGETIRISLENTFAGIPTEVKKSSFRIVCEKRPVRILSCGQEIPFEYDEARGEVSGNFAGYGETILYLH